MKDFVPMHMPGRAQSTHVLCFSASEESFWIDVLQPQLTELIKQACTCNLKGPIFVSSCMMSEACPVTQKLTT